MSILVKVCLFWTFGESMSIFASCLIAFYHPPDDGFEIKSKYIVKI